MTNNISSWVKAFRLRTLPLSLSCILTGTSIALKSNQFNWLVFSLLITTTILLQILSNLANDYGDSKKGTDNNNRVGPERALQSGKISFKQMKLAIMINSILAFVSGILLIMVAIDTTRFLSIIAFVILGIGAIFAAIKYTMGKNPYGYSGLGDLFVFLFFGIIGVIGTCFMYTNSFEYEVILPSITIGLLSTAVLNMNNMRDEDNDKACNKKTLVVKLGNEKSKKYHTALIIVSFVSLTGYLIIFEGLSITLISIIPYLLLFKNINTVRKNKIKSNLDPELKKIALSTFAISMIYCITTIINSI